ncbi:MAG: hypothetical protein M3Q73_01200 [bacterium]|nr:hypothetical protein [bacterium]
MKGRILIFGVARAALIIVLFIILALLMTNTAEAAVKDWQKSASIYETHVAEFSSPEFKESLQALKNTGANYVALVIPYHQKDISASHIFAGDDTPSDKVLIETINYAHSIGLNVMLKPHLGPDDGAWRALINPSNRNKWFKSYSKMLNHLADIAEQTKAEEICIGTELITVASAQSNPKNTEAWIAMIKDMRSRYSGKLTYSANWGGNEFLSEAEHVEFWSHLDYIGLSAYFQLAPETRQPKVQDFMKSWKYWDDTKIAPLYNKYKKPILFTEVGYRSLHGANADPYDGERKGGIDLELQANLYQALMQYWNAKPYMAGINMWNWNIDSLDGGVGNTQYTIQHKPAEKLVKKWFTGVQNQTVAAKMPTSLGTTTAVVLATSTDGKLARTSQVVKLSILNKLNYTYATSWSVDGGDAVWMKDDPSGTLYEQDIIDVSGWRWRANGPYKLTFTFREFSGKIIAQKTIDIYLTN